MKFSASLIVVSDMERSKAFYKTLLGQKVKFDFGEKIRVGYVGENILLLIN